MKISFSQLIAGLCFGITLDCQAQVDVTGLDHVPIRVTSLEASTEWYEARFGSGNLQERKGAWMIDKGRVRISLFLVDKPKPLDDLPSRIEIEHYAFGASGDRLQTDTDQLRAAGVSLNGVEDTESRTRYA